MLLAAGLTDINFALSFWTFITFALLIVVLGKFAWGPILQMIETREKTIAEAIEAAKRERAAAEAASARRAARASRRHCHRGRGPPGPDEHGRRQAKAAGRGVPLPAPQRNARLTLKQRSTRVARRGTARARSA